jgi:hypothetical protein
MLFELLARSGRSVSRTYQRLDPYAQSHRAPPASAHRNLAVFRQLPRRLGGHARSQPSNDRWTSRCDPKRRPRVDSPHS